MLRRFTSLCILALLCSRPIETQTLAHPGWRGNGITSQVWWKHATFVRLDADTTFADAVRTLDAMADTGVDSMILPDLQPAPGAALPFDERLGTEDDLDALLHEASARRMHVLVTIPVGRLSAGGSEVRFWMTRGIAGVDVGGVNTGDLSVLRGVRSAIAHFRGQRILIGHTSSDTATKTPERPGADPITIHLLSMNEAQRGTQSQPFAMDISDAEGLATWIRGAVPIFDEALLRQEESRSRIRTAVALRASMGSHRYAGRHP